MVGFRPNDLLSKLCVICIAWFGEVTYDALRQKLIKKIHSLTFLSNLSKVLFYPPLSSEGYPTLNLQPWLSVVP